MAEWLYKATKSKAGPKATTNFARSLSFLCRSLHNDKDKKKAKEVGDVKVEDVIHFYYTLPDKNAVRIGRFRVITIEEHDHPEVFGGHIADMALVTVKDPSFITKNDPHKGYKVDPKLGVFTGWLLEYLGDPMPIPKDFEDGRSTLKMVGKSKKKASKKKVA